MLFRVDSWESQLKSYRKSITNNNNINNLRTNYLITNIEIDLVKNDGVQQNNDDLNMKADSSIDTNQKSNTRVVDGNNFPIRTIHEDEKKDYQDGDNPSKYSDESLNDRGSHFHYKNRTGSIDTTKESNFFSTFFNFM